MNAWGSMGLQPIVRPGDDGPPLEDIGRFFDPNRQPVMINGKQYYRVGEDLNQTWQGWDPAAQAYLRNLSPEQRGFIDPTYGGVVPADTYGRLAEIMGPINAGGSLDFLPQAFMGAVTSAITGGMLPGMDAATGAFMPAGSTGLIQNLGSLFSGNPLGGAEAWGVNPRGAMDLSSIDLDQFVKDLGPVMQAAGGPGGWVAQNVANAALTGGAAGAGGAGSVVSLLTPKNLLTAAGILGGGLAQSGAIGSAVDAASGAQLTASQQGIAEQRRQFDALKALLEPYAKAGTGSLSAQQDILGLNGPQAQQGAISGIEASPQFSSLIQQGENAMLQNASATGGLRGGNIQAALAKFRPEILNALIDQQYGRLGGLTSVGQNAATFTGNAGTASGNNISNLLQQGGAAQAGNYLAKGKADANLYGNIANAVGLYAGLSGGF